VFNSLTGKVTGTGQGTLFVTTAGVEWELEVSTNTLRTLAGRDEARIFTHLVHREDQMRLYGFANENERRVFLELIGVTGIGPRAAMRMLSGTTPERIIMMLEGEDVDGLTQLPGLGKKTAQKIILALRGKLVQTTEAESGGEEGEVVSALVEMGFERGAAARAVNRIAPVVEETDASARERELLRRAIVELSRETGGL
jgi:Holliday junction DNA helicase RuvA